MLQIDPFHHPQPQFGTLPNTVMSGIQPGRGYPQRPFPDMNYQPMMIHNPYGYGLMMGQGPPMASNYPQGNQFNSYPRPQNLAPQIGQNMQQNMPFQPQRQQPMMQPRPPLSHASSVASSQKSMTAPSVPKSEPHRKLRLQDPKTGQSVALPESKKSRCLTHAS